MSGVNERSLQRAHADARNRRERLSSCIRPNNQKTRSHHVEEAGMGEGQTLSSFPVGANQTPRALESASRGGQEVSCQKRARCCHVAVSSRGGLV